ncbi:hypothetical protein BN130_1295 [Cronobacter malonaticus 507]|nr:hypothetical protein BN130_1295 [Cronobacter malonaticus 507]
MAADDVSVNREHAGEVARPVQGFQHGQIRHEGRLCRVFGAEHREALAAVDREIEILARAVAIALPGDHRMELLLAFAPGRGKFRLRERIADTRQIQRLHLTGEIGVVEGSRIVCQIALHQRCIVQRFRRQHLRFERAIGQRHRQIAEHGARAIELFCLVCGALAVKRERVAKRGVIVILCKRRVIRDHALCREMLTAPAQQRAARVVVGVRKTPVNNDVVKLARRHRQQIAQARGEQLNIGQPACLDLLLPFTDTRFIKIDPERDAVRPGAGVGDECLACPAANLQHACERRRRRRHVVKRGAGVQRDWANAVFRVERLHIIHPF